MQGYLVFQLYAPLVSWGDQAVGQERPSADHPSRSALLGLVAAALGIDRADDAQHKKLSAACRFGTKLYLPGLALRDFHTTQVPPSNKKTHHLYTRKDELSESKVGTILSFRTYQQDSYSVVGLWLESAEKTWSLSQLQTSLNNPHFQLYLGRKSCPLALPLNPNIIESERLDKALDQYTVATQLKSIIGNPDKARYYWEQSDKIGMDGEQSYSAPRYDHPTSRQRWQFTSRDEYVRFGQGEHHVSK